MVTEAEFRKAVEVEPTLCSCGLASMYVRNYRTRHLKGDEFAKSRAELLARFDEFCRAVDFMKLCQLRRTPNTRHVGGSYHLKHAAERWAGEYVSNGALIAAVIHLGIPYKAYDDTLNIHVAVSSKCPMASEKYAEAVS